MNKNNNVKQLNFRNDKSLIASILTEDFFDMSSLDSSQNHSDLNFSTFRSCDFPSFIQYGQTNPLDKSIPLCKASTKATITNIRNLNFRNNGKLINKIICKLSLNSCEVPKVKKMNFICGKQKVSAILDK